MPNWCYNRVVVTGTTEDFTEFLEYASKPHRVTYHDWRNNQVVTEERSTLFWNFITPPDEILDQYFGNKESKASFDGVEVGSAEWWQLVKAEQQLSNHWYDWNITHWGTKWDVGMDEVGIDDTDTPDARLLSFDTAWSPAEPVYYAMAEKFPKLRFEYEITEEANFYAGKMLFENGQLVSEEWVDTPSHNDFAALDIPCPYCYNGDYEVEDYLTDDCPRRPTE